MTTPLPPPSPFPAIPASAEVTSAIEALNHACANWAEALNGHSQGGPEAVVCRVGHDPELPNVLLTAAWLEPAASMALVILLIAIGRVLANSIRARLPGPIDGMTPVTTDLMLGLLSASVGSLVWLHVGPSYGAWEGGIAAAASIVTVTALVWWLELGRVRQRKARA